VRVTERLLLTAEDVAELLSVPVSWVRESSRSGAIPCVRLGRYVRFVEADVIAWLEGCKQPGRSVTLRSVR
jgi:excisionase family DNA binding protein